MENRRGYVLVFNTKISILKNASRNASYYGRHATSQHTLSAQNLSSVLVKPPPAISPKPTRLAAGSTSVKQQASYAKSSARVSPFNYQKPNTVILWSAFIYKFKICCFRRRKMQAKSVIHQKLKIISKNLSIKAQRTLPHQKIN